MNEVVDEIYENETAEELYERIQREKGRLISEGKLKKQKKLPEISEDEIPFEIPKSWKWVRLGEVINIVRGASPRPIKKYLTNSDHGVNWIKIGDADKDGKYINSTKEKIISDGALKSRFVKKGDFILSNSMSFGRPYILNIDGCVHDGWLVLSQYMKSFDINFLYYVLSSEVVFNQFLLSVSGAVVENLNSDKVRVVLIPLPPLSEQKRISELIDRLFEKLDEAKEKAISALNTFELRKAKILHLAIQGKLSKQLDEYETAEELYEKIQIEKEKLISEGKLKKQKKLPEISQDEIPFEIPKSWKWVRLGEVFNIIMGQSPDGESINTENNGVEFHQGKIYFDKDYILESEYFTSKPTKIVEANTVLLCVRATVGTLNITNRTICIGRGLCGIDTFKNIDPKFILYFLRGFEQDFIKKATGTTFIAITVEVIKNQVFPLPPLEEQEQILRLLDDIFEKEEKAKKLIESTLNKIELVKKSILARAVRGEL